jgi:ankyrin repeat protein
LLESLPTVCWLLRNSAFPPSAFARVLCENQCDHPCVVPPTPAAAAAAATFPDRALKATPPQVGVNLDAADKEGGTAAIWAAAYNHHDCVRVLKEAGADLGARDKDGFTAWSYARIRGSEECLALLPEDPSANSGRQGGCCEGLARRIAGLPTYLFAN